MRRFRFPIAVAVTSLALVAAVVAVGALVVPNALATAVSLGGTQFGPHGFGGPGFALPPELRSLADLPPGERFAHFVGVQVRLKDKDNRPLTVSVIPGTATAVSPNSLTLAANDGTARTFALNDETVIHGGRASGGTQAARSSLANGDQVVVVTLGDEATARAVFAAGQDGTWPGGFGGPPGWGRPAAFQR